MKIIFMGTPDYVIEPLKMLIGKHRVIALITQPIETKLCAFARENNIPVFKFNNINLEGGNIIRELKPDLMITASFGQMIKQNILDIAPIYNIHPSLIPKYRGATPVQTAILNGDTTLGVTIIKTELGMDSGDIYAQKLFEIDADKKADEVLEVGFKIGGELMMRVLTEIETGKTVPVKQDETKASKTRLLKKEDGLVDFNKTSREIYNQFRAMQPWPGLFCYLNGKLLKVWDCKPVSYELKTDNKAGTVIADNKNIYIKCGERLFLHVLELQLEGGKRLKAGDFLNGKNINGAVLSGKQ